MLDLDGQPLVTRVVRKLAPVCSEVYLVAGGPDPYRSLGFPVLIDEYPGEGPLGALITILDLAAAPWNVVLSCDLAGVETGPLATLAELALEGGVRAVIPRSSSGPEPLHAIFHRDLAPDLRRLWNAGERGLIRALSNFMDIRQVSAADLDASPAQFLNVNTPEDWLLVRGGERV